MRDALLELGADVSQGDLPGQGRLPPWLGARALHFSYRSALLAKLPEHCAAVFDDGDPTAGPTGRGRSSRGGRCTARRR